MMTCKHHKFYKMCGQSVLEFILMSFSFLTIFFIFFQLALGLGVSNYVHYATFMAARALQSAGPNENDQKTRAAQSLRHYLGEDGDRFRSIIRASQDEGGEGGAPQGGLVGRGPAFAQAPWQQGAQFTFEMKAYLFPMIGVVSRRARQKFTLTSESWLGREPTQQDECEPYMLNGRTWVFDNGC